MFPVDIFRASVEKAARIFLNHSIRFHLTGGVSSVVYGEPRMTQDIDVVADPLALAERLAPFLDTLEVSDFLYDATAIREAVSNAGMFQLLDKVEALKLDIYARELIPGELSRSSMLEVFDGLTLPVVSRADAAASKLVWISKGSHKSRADLRQIVNSASDGQQKLIRDLADRLQLSELLDEVLRESDEFL